MVRTLAKQIALTGKYARGLVSDRRGVAAVEFAAVLPFLVLLALGTVELADGVTAKNKLTHVISSLADLVAQSKVVTNTDMTNILNSSSVIMDPFDGADLRVIVSGISVDANSNAKVLWSDARHTDPLQIGTAYVLPPDLKVANTFLVVAEGHYTYTPTAAYLLTGPIVLGDRFFLVPRLTSKVCRPPQTAQTC